MRSHNCHLNLFDMGRSYSNLQLPSLQKPKTESRVFLLFLFILPLVLFSIYTNFLHIFPSPQLSSCQPQIIFHRNSISPCSILSILFDTQHLYQLGYCNTGGRKLAAFIYFFFRIVILCNFNNLSSKTWQFSVPTLEQRSM